LVERFFNTIKQCRRGATRDDMLTANYLAFIQHASLALWLRVNESASRHYATPSFFCRLVDDVVYWNVSFLSGKT
jgi:hypothetical protein